MKKIKHIILGRGNLGQAFGESLGEAAHLVSTHDYYPNLKAEEEDLTVWYCIGAGSVEFCARQPGVAMDLHLSRPLNIAKALGPKQKLVVFSSDYAEQFQRSHYAMSKYFMELALEPFENVHCYRVSSLYGPYNPMKTFPGKIIESLVAGRELRFSENMVMPTPVEWLAKEAIRHVEMDVKNAYIVPTSGIPAHEWGKWVLFELKKACPDIFERYPPNVNPEYFTDQKRPLEIIGRGRYIDGGMGLNSPDYLWSQHGQKTVKAALQAIGLADE